MAEKTKERLWEDRRLRPAAGRKRLEDLHGSPRASVKAFQSITPPHLGRGMVVADDYRIVDQSLARSLDITAPPELLAGPLAASAGQGWLSDPARLSRLPAVFLRFVVDCMGDMSVGYCSTSGEQHAIPAKGTARADRRASPSSPAKPPAPRFAAPAAGRRAPLALAESLNAGNMGHMSTG